MTQLIFRFPYIPLLFWMLFISGCKKNIEVDPPYTSFYGENVFTTDGTAISAVTSMYANMGSANLGFTGIPSLSLFAGLSADELALSSSLASELLLYHFRNELLPTSNSAPIFWPYFFQTIYLANTGIEGISHSTTLSLTVKQQLLGELYFMRAFCYFYLVNLYGDVPLVLTINYKLTSLLPRSPTSEVWHQIVSDLLNAKELLNVAYVEGDVVTTKSTTERVRPNKWAATALLARAYLFTNDYVNAEAMASEVIEYTTLYGLSTNLGNVFLKTNNKEAIWQVQGVTTGWNTNDARVFILPATGPNSITYPVYVSKKLQFSFESGDLRKVIWLDSVKIGSDTFYYAHKYKSAILNAPVTEYLTVLRLAEQYLIRAESRAQQDNFIGAQNDLNKIRNRAGLPNTTAETKEDLKTAILKERRSELFTEWGHRWLDLKRTGVVDAVIGAEATLKGGSWQSKDQFYPISTDELIANPNLTQTPGY